MSEHKNVLKDIILNFLKNYQSEIKEETIELKYDSETLIIKTRSKDFDNRDKYRGNKITIHSIGNYMIDLGEIGETYLNLSPLFINFIYKCIKSPSYYDIVDVLNNTNLMISGCSYNCDKDIIFEIEPKYLVLNDATIFHYLEKFNTKHNATIIYNRTHNSLNKHISFVNNLNCKHLIIRVWPYHHIQSQKFLNQIQTINRDVSVIALPLPKIMDKYLFDKKETFAKHENLTSIQCEDNDKIVEVYNRDKYLDTLNIRRLKLHFNKTSNLLHPLTNKNILNLIESFLY